MKLLTALGISIGVLAAVLIVIEFLLSLTGVAAIGIASWAGFVAWACYFAVGGKPEGMLKVWAANTAGAIVSVLILLLMMLLGFLGNPAALAVAVLVGAFVLVVQANWKVLSFIPGAFCGCAVAFGFGVGIDIPLLIACILSMMLGAFFGYLSDIWGNAMVKKEPEAEAPAEE